MILITSGAYLDQEFRSEFGRIPPAFLPVGNRRLYTYQVDSLPAEQRKVMTLPESFSVPSHDLTELEKIGVEVLFLDENLSLGQSVVTAINLSSHGPDAPLYILHGDTLITDLPAGEPDLVTLSEIDGAYNWAVHLPDHEDLLVQLDDTEPPRRVQIANGYFAFSDSGLLVRSIISAGNNFVQGINVYARTQAVSTRVVDHWLDFGHIHTFYRSKSRMTTQRAFNDLSIGHKIVRKTSTDANKMNAEYRWFKNLPDDLRVYAPHLIRRLEGNEPGYELEYLYLTSLNEMYVFGMLPAFVWRDALRGCFDFLDACRGHSVEVSDTESSLFLDKTRRRLEQFSNESGTSLTNHWSVNGAQVPDLMSIADSTAEIIPVAETNCLIHGDFCFSNILFDFRTQSIKVIDPRGLDGTGTLCAGGDPNYDIAKLAHSVCGLYDFIVAGFVECSVQDHQVSLVLPRSQALDDTQSIFLRMVAERGVTREQVFAMQVHLFLAMLPLHQDHPERQQALLGNALRLFTEIQ